MNNEPKDGVMPLPSHECVIAMRKKRDFSDSIIADYLDQRRALNNKLYQNEIDLKHLGYHFPMMPKERTETEFRKWLNDNGQVIIGSGELETLKASCEERRKDIIARDYMIEKLGLVNESLRAKVRAAKKNKK